MEKVFIFSIRIARNLVTEGYRIIDVVENQQDKKRAVFVFENTEDIREYLKREHKIKINK